MLPVSSSLEKGFQLSMDLPLQTKELGIGLQVFPGNLHKQLASKSRLPSDSVICMPTGNVALTVAL